MQTNKVVKWFKYMMMGCVSVILLSGCGTGREYAYEGSTNDSGQGVIKQTVKKSYKEYEGIYKDYKVINQYALMVEFEIEGDTKYFKISSDTELLNSFHKGKKVSIKVDEYNYIENKAELVE